ncbi:MAG TPA: polysaccharide biosynthesis tyrosine autokinase [Thiolapillus brandeum]|uniref:non-specific protein-tyrosine kinase n=1 Tax=Thiolapillus brandeum TaxID=1076588 RepID=A0A831RUA9_9GAMM|nr:polysaccharide biosynthesis tyrosine autokinase [Thiolapillus brandeum]
MNPGNSISKSSGNPLALSDEERELSLYDRLQAGGLDEEEERPKLKEYWVIIVRHKFTILLFTLIALVASAIYTSLQTPIYRSSVKLQIDREAARIVSFEGVTPREAAYSFDFYETQYQLLKSRGLAKRVIEQLGLESSDQFKAEEKSSFFREIKHFFGGGSNSGGGEDKPGSSSRGLENLLLSNLTVSPIKNSRLVVVSYDSPNPELAAKVVNALAKSFIDTTMERRFENSSYAKTFLSDRIKQVRANLEESERKLVEYAGEREIVDMDSKQSILMQKLEAVNTRLTEVEAERIKAESRFQEMKVSGADSFDRVTDNEVIQAYKERLAELEGEYQDNLRVFKPAYPKMQRLQGQIKELKRKISEESSGIQSSIKSDYQAAVREQAMLQSRMADIKGQILELQRKSTDYQALKRDVETNRELYDGLLQRIKEVGVAAGVGANNISIIDKGEVPGAAYKPNLKRNLQIALIIGLLGGIGLAFLFEHLDDTIKSASEIEKLTELPALGVIPEVRLDSDTESIALKTWEEPKSAIAEAYRSCRTALSFSSPSGSPDVLHVTSSMAGEGKTTSAISLALVYVQAGANVLLVDADLRNPSLHNELGLPNDTGLTNYLVGGYKASEVIQEGLTEGLYVLSTGPLPPNPAELLGSGRMKEFLQTAADKFDLVIVDGPPVLGLADALILANMSSATVMVVDAGVTRTGALKGAVQRLRQARANVLGALLVKYGQGRSGYGYDYQYDYNYYSYAADEAEERPKLAS